ncbi:DUF4265 domain-containing protein [Flavobacterium amniphilum]|uniref:DUF4265 domain-containing protein n=1 Tax=Flavobacterium amniphilum TaxID=1834035 RepID=UPI002029CC22|nr:DUF4265 domain-containing protein [Flavobacterium amniphilum]MCL9804387.1 DUF4265 domain-containing protein [Flavobacterium amniphilum]
MDNTSKKIIFRYYSDVLEEEIVETMWAETLDEENGVYKLDSIPFYGPLIATDDIFYAEFDESEGGLTFREVIEYSGNSIVQIVITQEDFNKEIIRDELRNLNCESEGLNDTFFSVEILESTDYKTIKSILDNYEESGVLSYAEPILSVKHSDDIA